MMPAEIVQLQKKQEAKFVCSACGADRGCDCNAPAVEKLAALTEQRRQARRTYDEKKRQQKQQSSDIRTDPEPVDQEAEIAEPAVIEDNLHYSIARMNAHARMFKKHFRASTFDPEAKERISADIDGMIKKWRSTQSALG